MHAADALRAATAAAAAEARVAADLKSLLFCGPA